MSNHSLFLLVTIDEKPLNSISFNGNFHFITKRKISATKRKTKTIFNRKEIREFKINNIEIT